MNYINHDVDFTTPNTDYYKCPVCGKIVEIDRRKKTTVALGSLYCPSCDDVHLFRLYMSNE